MLISRTWQASENCMSSIVWFLMCVAFWKKTYLVWSKSFQKGFQCTKIHMLMINENALLLKTQIDSLKKLLWLCFPERISSYRFSSFFCRNGLLLLGTLFRTFHFQFDLALETSFRRRKGISTHIFKHIKKEGKKEIFFLQHNSFIKHFTAKSIVLSVLREFKDGLIHLRSIKLVRWKKC